MDVYGLTGGIGSGKSTVAAMLEDYGVPVVSADELSRVVVAGGSEGLQAVVDHFGSEILNNKGELNRRRMANLVFRDAQKRRELEAILHPRIRDRFEQVLDALEKAGHEVAVYEVPLLFERNLQGEMKAVVLVTASIAQRIARVQARDDVTATEIRARIAAQMDDETKRRRADYVIENDRTRDDLRREVEFMMSRFLRLSDRRRESTPTPAARISTGGFARADDVPSESSSGVGSPSDGVTPTMPKESGPADDAVGVPPTATPSDAGRASGPPTTESIPADQRITQIDTGPSGS